MVSQDARQLGGGEDGDRLHLARRGYCGAIDERDGVGVADQFAVFGKELMGSDDCTFRQEGRLFQGSGDVPGYAVVLAHGIAAGEHEFAQV